MLSSTPLRLGEGEVRARFEGTPSPGLRFRASPASPRRERRFSMLLAGWARRRFGRAFGLAQRQPQRERASLAQLALYPHFAVQLAHHLANDRQPEPGAALHPCFRAPAAKKALEQAVSLLARQSDARVRDRDRNARSFSSGCELNRISGARVLHRVG